MASVIQIHSTNLLKDLVTPTGKKCSCPPGEKRLSECLVYHAQANRSDMNQTNIYYITCKTF